MSRIFRQPMGGATRKALAVRLADFADDEGRGIWPSVDRLAEETELSVRTVQRLLADFVEEGILVLVKKASGRPGEANRYDFDLARLFETRAAKENNPAVKTTGDTVTPVEGVQTGVTVTERGDTDAGDGCHGVTRTVIEPPVNHHEREGASERDGQEEENHKTIVRKFDKWWPTYPGYAGTSRDAALKEWMAMSRQEREDCIIRTPAFIKATQAIKGSFVWPSVYLRERKWLLMDEPTSAVATQTVHNPFSRPWMALRLCELMKPMRREGWPALSQFQTVQARDPEKARQINRERMARYGWPKVTEMHDKADRRHGMLVHGPLVGISEGFVKMHRDSDEAAAWKALHERKGWPWLPEPTPEWLWMPEGEPEAAMAELQAKLNEATCRGISDDAA